MNTVIEWVLECNEGVLVHEGHTHDPFPHWLVPLIDKAETEDDQHNDVDSADVE